ncbi:lipid-A-disaccharide synthase [Roseiconus nitratireducens]|uniref:Lipid-A-disaccharide synthase n=1 Tax=Roseiconus nitratireducens TaxID=2605748 RepID=A0A5M6D0N2_9BACT|nr:lipid-A-disaccharide synthase [Roseiconus nitratireducens]KAA5541047.1 lipid-A-disaccharide synthase [Roseiconus nitratireducens]
MSKTIFFSVGEPSGDQHAARLIDALRLADPSLRLRGFGGPRMAASGCDVDLDLTSHAVVGLLEVLPKLRQFFRFADQAEAVFASGQIEAVVLVDFPGFNWHIAKRAKKFGIPVYYYCPPQLWAWGGWRIKKMKATVDHVLTVLPIEQTFFSDHGLRCTYVGHPFFDAVAETELDRPTLDALNASAGTGGRTVAVLPGSRTHEVHRNWPIMLQAIRRLAERHPDVRFAVAAYREKHLQECRESLLNSGPDLPVDFYVGATSEIIESAACAMMVSGSVSLELMARNTPAAVLYRVGRFLYAFGNCVVKVDSMTLPNLMDPSDLERPRDQRAFPEMVSVGSPNPAVDFLVRVVDQMIGDGEVLAEKQQRLEQLCQRYARPGASRRAAQRVLELLESADPSQKIGAARQAA